MESIDVPPQGDMLRNNEPVIWRHATIGGARCGSNVVVNQNIRAPKVIFAYLGNEIVHRLVLSFPCRIGSRARSRAPEVTTLITNMAHLYRSVRLW